MGRPICAGCPPGTGEHRVKSKSFGCPNKACVNFLSLRNGPHKADAVDEAATVAMAELSECLQQEDENGHRIVGLRYRADVSALKDAVTLLRASNLSLGSIMFLAGFLHILYWSWPTMTAVGHHVAGMHCFESNSMLVQIGSCQGQMLLDGCWKGVA